MQVEEYGEHYQRLAWGLALDIMSADANDTARRDKVRTDAGWRCRVYNPVGWTRAAHPLTVNYPGLLSLVAFCE